MRIILFFLLIAVSPVLGQNVLYRKVNEAERQSRIRSYDLFRVSDRPGIRSASPAPATKSLQLNEAAARKIWLEDPKTLSFSLPSDSGALTLKLISRNIFSPDFRVTDGQNREAFNRNERYYRGVIEGDSSSLVSVTLSEQGVSVYLYGDQGNYHLSKRNEIYGLRKIENDLPALSCAVRDTTEIPVSWEPGMNLRSSSTEFVNCNPVQVYFEVDYSLFQTVGNTEGAIAAITRVEIIPVLETRGMGESVP